MLIHHTLVARLPDGLPLVATMESSDPPQLEKLKKLVKTLLRKMASGGNLTGLNNGLGNGSGNGEARSLPPWCSVLAGDYTFQ